MSTFTGPQGKGAMRRHRAAKRAEAAARAQRTPHERTRKHRLNACTCATPEGRLLRAVFEGSA